MKKAIKNYLTQLRENEEKGFSLVELIIVMAIMAILVGVVASQVIPYMEKSRQSKDQQQISGLATDITAAIASSGQTAANVGTSTTGEQIDGANGIAKLGGTDAAACTKIVDEFISLRDPNNSGTTVADVIDDVQDKLKSKAANQSGASAAAKKISDGEIYMIYDTATSKLTLFMGSDNTLANAVAKLTVESE